MKKRIKKVPFYDMDVMQGMALCDFVHIFKQLPPDAEITGFGREIGCSGSYLIVESKDFEETEYYDTLPNFLIDLDEMEVGEAEIRANLDMAQNCPKPETSNLISYDPEKWANPSFFPENHSIYDIQYEINELAAKISKAQEELGKPKISMGECGNVLTILSLDPLSVGYAPILQPDKISIVNARLPINCSHQWKKYVGLTQEYDYCETCNEKKV